METTESGGGDDGADGSSTEGSSGSASVDAAVAAEWNAMRARVWDALSLGVAGDTSTGASVAGGVFERFEAASGEYGAHEALERTSESNYGEFEEAINELRTAGLGAGNVQRAREEAGIADEQLAAAQEALVGETTSQVLELQLIGANVLNAGHLAAAGKFEAATSTAGDALGRFEEASVHDALEEANGEAYETFEAAVEGVESAAKNGDAETAGSKAREAFGAAIDGSYSLADSEAAAGAGHVAALQARGWDAAALADMGGPPTAFAHAVGLTIYRARAHDAALLAGRGETERAATTVGDVFAHFEGAKAHEALEEASGEAYEGFESGLSKLETAIRDGGALGEALGTVDENLVKGIEALAGVDAPLLEAAFFRARLADARELYRIGDGEAAKAAAEDLFERFEADELGFHESVESTSEEIYERFEEEHLSGLIDAFGSGDDSAVDTHYQGAQSALLEYEEKAGGRPTVSGAEAAYLAARGFDAAVVDVLGDDARAKAIAEGAFEHFEAGAGGFHEAIEEADAETYESFEQRLGAVASAADGGEDVYPVAKEFGAEALAAAYAIVGAAGGSQVAVAASAMQSTFEHFEEARVHEMLEEADHSAYESFERTMKAYLTALQEDGDVDAAAETYARGAQYAQFALVDAVEELPLDLRVPGGGGGSGGGHSEHDHSGSSKLEGGPNVVEGVPDDADHVVDMKAVSFDPADLTVSKGDTVAFKHTAGEAHTVFAYEGKIPDGADYWASGGFDSQSAAEKGWENGKGAVESGHSYVHTFETRGTHEYYCAPHEMAGMKGSITVE